MDADQQILRGSAATLSWQNLDGNGEPAAPAGTVTVGILRDDGTELVAAGTATAGTGSAPRTYALAATANTLLDRLVVTWTDGGDASVHVTYVEVVGGFYFTVAEVRASDPALVDSDKYPAALIQATRREVEEEFETICDVAFVPRYASDIVSRAGDFIRPGHLEITSVRSVTDWSAGDLATIEINDWGMVGSNTGVAFARYAVIRYEHGLQRPPAEVKRAAMQRLRYRMNQSNTGIPDRATSYSAAEGGTYALARAGTVKTGMDDVDAVLARHSRRTHRVA